MPTLNMLVTPLTTDRLFHFIKEENQYAINTAFSEKRISDRSLVRGLKYALRNGNTKMALFMLDKDQRLYKCWAFLHAVKAGLDSIASKILEKIELSTLSAEQLDEVIQATSTNLNNTFATLSAHAVVQEHLKKLQAPQPVLYFDYKRLFPASPVTKITPTADRFKRVDLSTVESASHGQRCVKAKY